MSASATVEPRWGVDVQRTGGFEKAGVRSPFERSEEGCGFLSP